MNKTKYFYKNTMKFLIATLFSMCFIFFITNIQVEAATFSASGPSSVEPNTEFTVTFGSGTTGKYSYSVSGGTIVSSSSWVEGGGSLTVKSGSSGTVKVTITADTVTTSDYEDLAAGTSKTVSVTINSATATPTATPTATATVAPTATVTATPKVTATPDTRSSDAKLKSLSISGVTLSPEFSSSETDYTAEIWDIDEIKISATANDSQASVSGTGTKTVDIGENIYEIVVTAENNTKKTYTITITKNENPTVFFDFGGESLGLVKNVSDIESFDGFDLCAISFDDELYKAWYSTPLDITILYLEGENQSGFYVYENEQITSKLQTISINDKNYYSFALDLENQEKTDYIYEEISINDTLISAWSFESDYFANYKILQLTDENGETNEYLYSILDETMIISPSFIPLSTDEYEALVEIEELLNQTISEKDETITSLESASSKTDLEIDNLNSTVTAQIIAIGILSVLLVAAIVVLVLKFLAKNNSNKFTR
ncbi:MAG: cadherin-like beta sandwich domain-containing protein [Clostridia bacterium]